MDVEERGTLRREIKIGHHDPFVESKTSPPHSDSQSQRVAHYHKVISLTRSATLMFTRQCVQRAKHHGSFGRLAPIGKRITGMRPAGTEPFRFARGQFASRYQFVGSAVQRVQTGSRRACCEKRSMMGIANVQHFPPDRHAWRYWMAKWCAVCLTRNRQFSQPDVASNDVSACGTQYV